MQSFTIEKIKRKKKKKRLENNQLDQYLWFSSTPVMLPASTHHVGDHSEEVTAAVAVDKGTKSVIAGKKSDSSGQTTATGGLLQSGPCAQPSKSMRLQEKKKKVPHRSGSDREPSVPTA